MLNGMCVFCIFLLFSLHYDPTFDVVHHYSRMLCLMKILLCCMRILLFWVVFLDLLWCFCTFSLASKLKPAVVKKW